MVLTVCSCIDVPVSDREHCRYRPVEAREVLSQRVRVLYAVAHDPRIRMEVVEARREVPQTCYKMDADESGDNEGEESNDPRVKLEKVLDFDNDRATFDKVDQLD